MEGYVQLTVTTAHVFADIIIGALSAQGFDVRTIADSHGAFDPTLSYANGVTVWVAEDQYTAAQDALSALDDTHVA